VSRKWRNWYQNEVDEETMIIICIVLRRCYHFIHATPTRNPFHRCEYIRNIITPSSRAAGPLRRRNKSVTAAYAKLWQVWVKFSGSSWELGCHTSRLSSHISLAGSHTSNYSSLVALRQCPITVVEMID